MLLVILRYHCMTVMLCSCCAGTNRGAIKGCIPPKLPKLYLTTDAEYVTKIRDAFVMSPGFQMNEWRKGESSTLLMLQRRMNGNQKTN